MAKCFYSGITIPLDKSYVLNVAGALKLLKSIKQQDAYLQQLIGQLGAVDKVKIFDHINNKNFYVSNRRVVSLSVMDTIIKIFEGKNLFLSWPEWEIKKHYGHMDMDK